MRDDTPELEAFFAAMDYSGLRPEELLHVRDDQCELPDPADADAWGWWRLSGATVSVGKGWGDGDETHESRSFKHRSKKSTRDVPIPPEEVRILRKHREKQLHDGVGTSADAGALRLLKRRHRSLPGHTTCGTPA